MDSPHAIDHATETELEARRRAEQRGAPFLVWRDDHGRQHLLELDGGTGSVTIGRRVEADVSLPFDPEVSRLHAELEYKAGDWTLADDGWSQNGTFVNGLRLEGRRRLVDGDLLRVGQTVLAYCHPRDREATVTLVPFDLATVPRFSEQQQRILRALCRPLFADGEGVNPASNAAIAERTGIAARVVAEELDALARGFGFHAMPEADRRAEIALLALRSGLVKADDTES
jgi:hypothetical protein